MCSRPSLLTFLADANPRWFERERSQVLQKLAVIGIYDLQGLLSVLVTGEGRRLNAKLADAGEKTFSTDTLQCLRRHASDLGRRPRPATHARKRPTVATPHSGPKGVAVVADTMPPCEQESRRALSSRPQAAVAHKVEAPKADPTALTFRAGMQVSAMPERIASVKRLLSRCQEFGVKFMERNPKEERLQDIANALDRWSVMEQSELNAEAHCYLSVIPDDYKRSEKIRALVCCLYPDDVRTLDDGSDDEEEDSTVVSVVGCLDCDKFGICRDAQPPPSLASLLGLSRDELIDRCHRLGLSPTGDEPLGALRVWIKSEASDQFVSAVG